MVSLDKENFNVRGCDASKIEKILPFCPDKAPTFRAISLNKHAPVALVEKINRIVPFLYGYNEKLESERNFLQRILDARHTSVSANPQKISLSMLYAPRIILCTAYAVASVALVVEILCFKSKRS